MNLNPEQILLMGALAVTAHVLLFAVYRYVHPVVLLLMAFAVISMLSTATLLPAVDALKWLRLYVAGLAVVIAVLSFRPSIVGVTSWAMIGFGTLYVAAALWSGAPVDGLMFKGMFLVTLLLGIGAVFVAEQFDRLWTLQRCMVLATAAVIAVVLIGVMMSPGSLVSGRLSVLGLNPNRIAEALAPLMLFCFFGLLYDPLRFWRLVCYAVAVPGMVMLLATGSRAGFGQVMIGFIVLMLPLVRRPLVFAAAAIAVGTGILIAIGFVEGARAVQIGTYDFTTRQAPWRFAMNIFRQNPIFGVGWHYQPSGHGYSSGNLHSIYVQVLVEMGIVGMIALLLVLGRAAWSGLNALNATVSEPALRPFVYLASAMLAAVVAHGVAESSALMGSSINAACLGISVAMFDWLLATARARRQWALAMHDNQPLAVAGAFEPR